MIPENRRPLLIGLVALSIIGAAYTTWLQVQFLVARNHAEQAARIASKEHEEAVGHAARARMLEAENTDLRAAWKTASDDAAKWKARAMRPVPVPQVPETEAEVAQAWVTAGFTTARGTGNGGVLHGLDDSKKALGVVLQAPDLSTRLYEAQQSILFTEARAEKAEAGWAGAEKTATEWREAHGAASREALQWKTSSEEKETALKVERRWGNWKVAGAVVITAVVVEALHRR